VPQAPQKLYGDVTQEQSTKKSKSKSSAMDDYTIPDAPRTTTYVDFK
jgi:hypothetical protein